MIVLYSEFITLADDFVAVIAFISGGIKQRSASANL
jgi:hypothetical protein